MEKTIKEIKEKFDAKFYCYHHPAECNGNCMDKYRDFVFNYVIPEIIKHNG